MPKKEDNLAAQDIQANYHPKDLPNDPPGKASNVSHAFRYLISKARAPPFAGTSLYMTMVAANVQPGQSMQQGSSTLFCWICEELRAMTLSTCLKSFRSDPEP